MISRLANEGVREMKRSILFLLFLLPFITHAQYVSMGEAERENSTDNGIDLILSNSGKNALSDRKSIKIENFIIPAIFVGYGIVSLGNNNLKSIDSSIRNEVEENWPHFKSGLDNYSQFLPTASVFLLGACGVRGSHSLKEEAIVGMTSLAISTSIVLSLKKITHVRRPDNSSYDSFPSQHTAMAFASAEFLRMEYSEVSPWIAIGGYVAATGTGVFRILNNKHWLSDVVAGAGIGMASTDLCYLLFDKLKNRKVEKGVSFLIYPITGDHVYGGGIAMSF